MPDNNERYQSNYTGADLDAAIGRSKAITATDQEINLLSGVTGNVQQQLNAKQGTLTPGTNITIDNNVISASGGFDPTISTNAMTTPGFNYGRKANTTVGIKSVALGTDVEASGSWSYAEGNGTHATANYSHAEGYNTTASQLYAHAEGSTTTASGQSSHTEGANTTASGNYSHAEGKSTNAIGAYSHAEGSYTYANGQYSHAEGRQTHATADYQHVQGKWNAEDNSKAFILGNGTGDSDRRNAMTVDWDGNVDIAGTLTGGLSYLTTAPTAANTQGIKLVVLSEEPATKYDGWLYIITE